MDHTAAYQQYPTCSQGVRLLQHLTQAANYDLKIWLESAADTGHGQQC